LERTLAIGKVKVKYGAVVGTVVIHQLSSSGCKIRKADYQQPFDLRKKWHI
jgi:hypothetical protein